MSELNDENLTFKPKINKPRTTKAKDTKPIWEKLHAQAEKYWAGKVDQEVDYVEFAKDPESFTFKP